MLSPFEMTFNALRDGISITLDGITFKLFKPNEEIPLMKKEIGVCDTYFLGIERTCSTSEGDNYIAYLGSDISFVDMLELLNKVSHEDAILYASQNAFNKYNKEKFKR